MEWSRRALTLASLGTAQMASFFPALAASGRPWVRIVSCNPAELKDPAIPPFSSGYPVADRSADAAFLQKPFTPESLGWKVHEVLAGPQA